MKQPRSKMLPLDLRDLRDRTQLDPWAHFQVLATMLAPVDKALRKRFLTHTLIPQPGVDPLSKEDLGNLLNRSKHRGRQVGFLICGLCELYHKHGIRRPTLEMAIQVIKGELASTLWDCFSPELAPEHMPRSGRLLRELYREFGSVGHYWAAVLIREQGVRHQAWLSGIVSSPEQTLPTNVVREEVDAFPRSLDSLPDFLATADDIWSFFDAIPKAEKFTRKLRITPWRFIIPERLRVEHKLEVLPLPADRVKQIKVIK